MAKVVYNHMRKMLIGAMNILSLSAITPALCNACSIHNNTGSLYPIAMATNGYEMKL